MEQHSIFLDLFLILISARVLGELFSRFGLPAVLGELSAGLVLGVSLLGWVSPSETLRILSEIGIVLLLFEIGLKTDLDRLIHTGLQSTVIAVFGAVFPFGAAALAAYYLFGQSIETAMFVGGTLMATSIGITLRVLKDIKQDQSNIAQIVIGAAVIDDIIGIVMLVFIYDYATAEAFTFDNTLRISGAIGLFILVAPILANLISGQIRKFDHLEQVPGMVTTLIVSLILLLSYLSQRLGAPEILGSFAAGIALSRRFFLPFGLGLQKDPGFLSKVKHHMKPLIQIFTPIFFVMIGLSIDVRLIHADSWEFWQMALFFTAVAVLGKFLGAFLIRQKCRMNQTLIGISMIPRGEVGLIFIEIGYVGGIIDSQIHAMLLFVIIVTTVVPPFLLKWLFKYECA